MTSTDDPDGYVVVLFGSKADGYCTLTRCPLGSAEWFPTRDEATAYCETLPYGFEPHILSVTRGRS